MTCFCGLAEEVSCGPKVTPDKLPGKTPDTEFEKRFGRPGARPFRQKMESFLDFPLPGQALGIGSQ
jgi:hypothetical protein